MIHNKKEFNGGLALLVTFFIVLFAMFQPLFDGHNAMAYLDNLYNSISKGSAYYVDKLKDEAKTVGDFEVDVTMVLASEAQAAQSVVLITGAGASAEAQGKNLTVKGNYQAILNACLDDADKMYHNDAEFLKAKYPEYKDKDDRLALYNWNAILGGFDRQLKKQKAFAEAKVAVNITAKVVETAYNYYKVVPEQIKDKMGIVFFSLAFYVVYTMWYGFGIMFVFEGWGLKISGH
jgi:ABC-type Na+ efflux pump permease subunit